MTSTTSKPADPLAEILATCRDLEREQNVAYHELVRDLATGGKTDPTRALEVVRAVGRTTDDLARDVESVKQRLAAVALARTLPERMEAVRAQTKLIGEMEKEIKQREIEDARRLEAARDKRAQLGAQHMEAAQAHRLVMEPLTPLHAKVERLEVLEREVARNLEAAERDVRLATEAIERVQESERKFAVKQLDDLERAEARVRQLRAELEARSQDVKEARSHVTPHEQFVLAGGVILVDQERAELVMLTGEGAPQGPAAR